MPGPKYGEVRYTCRRAFLIRPPCRQASPLLAVAGIAGHEQCFDVGHIFGDSLGRRLPPIVPEAIEQCGGQGCELAPYAHLTVALACFAVERARVQALDIEAAQESFPFVHDQELAMVALSIL